MLTMFLCIVVFISPSSAEDIYVAGITKATMRTGPGIEHKIVDILKTGDKLDLVEYKNDWSLLKKDQGKTGWVLTRFLTREIPDIFLIENLKKENQELISKIELIEDKNNILTDENAALVQIKEKYNKLKQESSGFLKLDAEYNKMAGLLASQKGQIKTLENNFNKEQKLLFLSGAGVFILGLFLGLSTRKKKRTRLL